MANKLFIGGLSWDTTDAKLSEFFSQAGTVVSANVITDKYTGKSRGFGFVEMSTDEEATKAKELNGQTLDGRAVAVNDAKPQEQSSTGYSRGSDRGNSPSRGNWGSRDTRKRY